MIELFFSWRDGHFQLCHRHESPRADCHLAEGQQAPGRIRGRQGQDRCQGEPLHPGAVQGGVWRFWPVHLQGHQSQWRGSYMLRPAGSSPM